MQFFTIQINKNKSTLHYYFQGASESEDHILLGSPKRRYAVKNTPRAGAGVQHQLATRQLYFQPSSCSRAEESSSLSPHPCQAPDGFQAPASAWPRSAVTAIWGLNQWIDLYLICLLIDK